ncbi:MAG: alpha/beta fold hydrolase [Acidobacteriota bacterium]|nr:alpha/beta fold hydrolase [Acidobacteriota bacterium]
MTIATWARRRPLRSLPPAEMRQFRTADDTTVVAACHWHGDRQARTTIVVMHGLEGSSDAHYMRGVADKAWRAGLNVVRLNQRNCGDTEHLTPGLYHSGLTDDPRAVMQELIDRDGLRAIVLAGYSMGGNVMLRLAGELGADAPAALKGVAAVSPVIDLAACVAAIEKPGNYVYQWNFMRNLRARMLRKARAFPAIFDLAPLAGLRTIRGFDDTYTAPHNGFGDAANYYYQASALRVISRIAVPALIIAAADDPFVPASIFDEPDVRANPLVQVEVLPHGGHCGFVAAREADDDGYWAESAIVAFASEL